jgi:glutathione synthase/RimK-type ligase-like ATP-grasp enzyme
MSSLLVVENPKLWQPVLPGTELVSAQEYLTNPRFVELRRARVYNLCRSNGYQTVGYYVSLLAAARGHRPLPTVTTLQDLRLASVVKVASQDMQERIQRLLSPLRSDRFELSIYFGRNMAKRYDRLSQSIFNHFPAPFLRAEFVHADVWRLDNVRAISWSDIPESHHWFVKEQAERFFERPHITSVKQPRFTLAILVDPEENDKPSDEKALSRFVRAAARLGMQATFIEREDFGRLPEFDALFIRATTAVNHYTYRFARRAAAEGMVVIDDPESIVRCTNKVYQAELFLRNGIPIPPTLVVHKGNTQVVAQQLGFPCVLKQPDSSFSAGVVKAKDADELQRELKRLLSSSELVVAQGYVPSDFDWRVGVLDGEALYVSKYYMARGHWQIQRSTPNQKRIYGKSETVAPKEAPQNVVNLAIKACNLIGNGLYGVDIKEVGNKLYVIEVNDNPSIDAGCEDDILKDELYERIMRSFVRRLEGRLLEPQRNGGGNGNHEGRHPNGNGHAPEPGRHAHGHEGGRHASTSDHAHGNGPGHEGGRHAHGHEGRLVAKHHDKLEGNS